MNKDFTFIDLFSGIGGFKMALSRSGGRCVGFSEISKDAIDAYCENYDVSRELNLGDITKIESLPKHDVLTAGVPCQSWSIAGRNLGFDDDRGQLWNDTLFLLNQSRPKAFIFENVKGLADPRNKDALDYILARIRDAGYFASYHIVNSYDYGVAQNRIRIYIIGFREKEAFENFQLPKAVKNRTSLADVLNIKTEADDSDEEEQPKDLFGCSIESKKMSLSSKNGFNDYFLFNDLRNGETTIHSWDIAKTSERQKDICMLLLRNRRKSQYGPLDGNPLSLEQFQSIDSSVLESELNELVELDILKLIDYRFEVTDARETDLDEGEKELIKLADNKQIVVDSLKQLKSLKVKRVPILETLKSLTTKKRIQCVEKRFDFKNTKISSGINGVNRVFMPSSNLFPTLVASDTNDYVALKSIKPISHQQYKKQFLDVIYYKGNYRKITKEEACAIQGFPRDFILPESRVKWMKLIGNSVSVPVIEAIVKSMIKTGILEEKVTHKI